MSEEEQKTLEGKGTEKRYLNADNKIPYEKYSQHGLIQSDIVSCWLKSMRIGDVESSTYWLTIMIKVGENPLYLAKRLWIFSFEDTTSQMFMSTAQSIYECVKKKIDVVNSLWAGTIMGCKSPKFYMDEDYEKAEHIFKKANTDFALKCVRKIPEWALDLHTKSGWDLKKKGEKPDQRISGNEIGRKWMFETFKTKKIDGIKAVVKNDNERNKQEDTGN